MDTIIIDDEAKTIRLLEYHLERYFDDFNIIGKYDDSREGLEAIFTKSPQVIFLDINMPFLSGIDVLKRIKHLDALVIFLTAHRDYAIEALRLNAFDYLLKPIETEELLRIHVKLKTELTKHNNYENSRIKITINNDIHFYEEDEIIYARSEGNYTTIYSTNKKPLVITKNLKKIENEYLSNHPFFKSHQSFIINLRHVKTYSDYEIVLKNEIKVPLSVRRHKHFVERI